MRHGNTCGATGLTRIIKDQRTGRMFALQFPGQLQAFLITGSGDGTGVDEVEVGLFCSPRALGPVDDGVAFVGETAQEVGGFGVVEFASEGVCCNFHEKNFVSLKNVRIFASSFQDRICLKRLIIRGKGYQNTF